MLHAHLLYGQSIITISTDMSLGLRIFDKFLTIKRSLLYNIFYVLTYTRAILPIVSCNEASQQAHVPVGFETCADYRRKFDPFRCLHYYLILDLV